MSAENKPDPEVTPAVPPEETKTLSLDEVNRREAELRRKYERRQKELETKLKELEEASKKAIDETKQVAQPPVSRAGLETLTEAGKLEVLEKRWGREKEDYERKLGELTKLVESEKSRAMSLERDRQLDEALNAVQGGVVDRLAAVRYFLPQIEWDPIDNAWIFKTKKGNVLTIMDGVNEECPSWLRGSTLKPGAGTHQGNTPPARTRLSKELEEAVKKEEELHKIAKTCSANDIQPVVAWKNQKKKVQLLRAQLEGART